MSPGEFTGLVTAILGSTANVVRSFAGPLTAEPPDRTLKAAPQQRPSVRLRMRPRSWRLVLAVAAVYVTAAKFGFTMAYTAEQVTLVWPPAGLALSALLLLGTEVWPGILLGAFVANATANEPLIV